MCLAAIVAVVCLAAITAIVALLDEQFRMGKLPSIAAYFSESGPAKRLWNSPVVGFPLWVLFACLCVWWKWHVPPPGYAIGALAVVAGVMSVREIKVLGKILWVFLLVFFLVTEFHAIDKDRAENARQQADFFREQRDGFKSIAEQSSKDFSETSKGLEAAMTALGIAIKQTHPSADLHYYGLKWEPPLSVGTSFPLPNYVYHINFFATNEGSEQALELKRLGRLYVGKEDDISGELRIKKQFDKDWTKAERVSLMVTKGEQPLWTEAKTFSDDEVRATMNGETVYFYVRLEYKDSLGIWDIDSCHCMQHSSDGFSIDMLHDCNGISPLRYRPKP